MIFQTTNPHSGEILETHPLLESRQMIEVLELSHQAYQEWKTLELERRVELFRRLKVVFEKKVGELGRWICLEMGKPITEACAEVRKCMTLIDYYCDNAAVLLQDRPVAADGTEHIISIEPTGVILSIMPWNFPLWQIMRFAVPTLMVGNTTIVKPALDCSRSALLVEEAFCEAGFPPHVFNICLVDHEEMRPIFSHPHLAGVSFTGSTEGGRSVYQLAAAGLKKCVLELGGSDPFLVFADADLEKTVAGARLGRTLNAGQSCIGAKRFLVEQKVYGDFLHKLKSAFSRIVSGDPLNSATAMGPLFNVKAIQSLRDLIDDAVSKGAVLWGGEIRNNFVAAGILTEVTPEMRVYREELFAPLAVVHQVKDRSEMVELANATSFGLGASLWGKDIAGMRQIAKHLECGSVFFNSIVKSDPRLPFGGVKESGFGRELGREGLLEFANIKTYNVYPG